MRETIRVEVNGRSEELEVATDERLVDVLRGRLGLTSVREACGIGVCGTCTVALDGRIVSGCLTLATLADGGDIRTVEGVERDGALSELQQAFVDHAAFQCAYCTPGFLLAAQALIDEVPDANPGQVRAYLAGNLCRCGSYLRIEAAVLDVLRRRQRPAPTSAGETDSR